MMNDLVNTNRKRQRTLADSSKETYHDEKYEIKQTSRSDVFSSPFLAYLYHNLESELEKIPQSSPLTLTRSKFLEIFPRNLNISSVLQLLFLACFGCCLCCFCAFVICTISSNFAFFVCVKSRRCFPAVVTETGLQLTSNDTDSYFRICQTSLGQGMSVLQTVLVTCPRSFEKNVMVVKW